jgi:ATP-dependent DNA ligase
MRRPARTLYARAVCTCLGDSTPGSGHLKTLAMPPSFIEPCLPSPADRPPSGSNWIHEIKHDGYRLMARRDPVGIRRITRRGNDWTTRFPPLVEAVNHLKVRSCLIDGEAVC